MIPNSNRSATLTKATARWLTMPVLYDLKDCLSPMAPAHTVIEYDKASTGIAPKQPLLNNARSHQHQALHSSIFTNGFTGRIASLLLPNNRRNF
jgi:hypothetical protein